MQKHHHSHFTTKERDLLAIWKARNLSNYECARRLNRHVSSIGRELKRNSSRFIDGKKYIAIQAQGNALRRRQIGAHAKHELKNKNVYKFVTDYLKQGWSPDQIAGRLKRSHSNDKYFWITAETIYRWIYEKKQIKKCWFEYLRRKQKKRKVYKGRKVHRSHIQDRISIHNRPERIDKRIEFGHWEGDSIEGKGHLNGLHTEVERVSRKIQAKHVEKINSEKTIIVQKEMFERLPKKARKSTTLDNGRENHLHFKLKTIGMKTYFADPYSSWQRGTNEHGNWHIRYYFPKGTDFSKVDDDELQDVVWEINNRPRKILDYQTADEVFNKNLLKTTKGVAINY